MAAASRLPAALWSAARPCQRSARGLATTAAARAESTVLVDVPFLFDKSLHFKRPSGPAANATYQEAAAASLDAILRLHWRHRPAFFAALFDAGPSSWRHELWPQFQEWRQAERDKWWPHYESVREICGSLGLPQLGSPGVDSTDLLATYARLADNAPGIRRVVVVSGHRALHGLVGGKVTVLNPSEDDRELAEAEVRAKFGVQPWQVLDLLALVGGQCKSLPGIPKIGPKLGAQLLKAHGTLEGVLQAAATGEARAPGVGPGRLADLQEFSENARQGRRLLMTRAADEAPPLHALRPRGRLDFDAAERLCVARGWLQQRSRLRLYHDLHMAAPKQESALPENRETRCTAFC